MYDVDARNLRERLAGFSRNGVGLYLEDIETSPEEIVRRMLLRDGSVYMPDFIMDDEGMLTEVRYDRLGCL